jgi:hypothetical protein
MMRTTDTPCQEQDEGTIGGNDGTQSRHAEHTPIPLDCDSRIAET